jgi:hypothetical protein
MRGWLIIFGGLGVAGALYSYAATPDATPSFLSLSGLCFFLLLAGLATSAVRGRAR